MRKLLNGLIYGSAEGPVIVIDWDRRNITFYRMSPRRVARILRWMRNAERSPS